MVLNVMFNWIKWIDSNRYTIEDEKSEHLTRNNVFPTQKLSKTEIEKEVKKQLEEVKQIANYDIARFRMGTFTIACIGCGLLQSGIHLHQ